MPPVKKYSRKDIIEIVSKMVEEDGLKAINARSVAKRLDASVQVIYHNFSTIDELINEVISHIYEKYRKYLLDHDDKEKPYLAKGMAYVGFARDYPEFFKILYMNSYDMSIDELTEKDKETGEIVKSTILANFKLADDDIEEFHRMVWIFTHGIACLVATSTITFSDEEIKNLLIEAVRDMYIGFNKRREK